MLPLTLGYLGFASSPASITGTACGDIPDSVMVGLTGGETCASLTAAGRCTSTDGVVARLMASSCQASCGTCGDSTRESRAYATSNYRGGDHTCKMWEPFGNDHVGAFPMEEDEAKKLVCEDVYQELELAYRWRETEQARRDCCVNCVKGWGCDSVAVDRCLV